VKDVNGEQSLKSAVSIFIIIMIMLAIVPAPLVRSESASSRQLGITPILERKDTYMLDLEDPFSGPYAWDTPHENRSSTDSPRCIKAAVSMIDAYYGGHLSQDRIAYHVYNEVLNLSSPYDDLGDGKDVTGMSMVPVLMWALSGASVARIDGKPAFSDIQYWIDNNYPLIRDHGASHFITVIYGYDTDGQMVYVIDPLTGNETKVPYDSLDVFVLWIVYGTNITARSDEPTIWMDSDGDGVVDFDEINRFHTDPYNNDTYGLGIDDKTMIKHIYFNLAFPTASFECSPQTAQANEQITFDASGSKGNITAYQWNFGDNNTTTTTAPIANHAYDQPGNYSVTLRVTDSNTLWNTTASLVTIKESVKPERSLSISNLTVSNTLVARGHTLQINATVNNEGISQETFNMTTYANGTAIETKETTLMNQTSTTTTFAWNTTGFAYGNYTISACVWPPTSETNVSNNNFTGGWVIVTIVGDITGPNGWPDGKVDMLDVAYVARHLGTNPSSSTWDPKADIDGDGKVDMRDVAVPAKNFGQQIP
jgi:PKD repeat protein